MEQIEQLKVALLRKHEEAKQIARQLEMCSKSFLHCAVNLLVRCLVASNSSKNSNPSKMAPHVCVVQPRLHRAMADPRFA